ncbi:uridine kinase [Halopseudomonas salegens]|uniref:Uridine kinase n=2 Tax=Halopseudomonas salegens TaxID=1434072 RepID=A0A1H2FA31_9GAMM|nr:uridine kinase [Halopseudomonas salegens]
MFADALGRVLRSSGASVIRASVDGFHHPRAVRYRRGRYSAEGFYRDSFDYARLKQALLDPLSPGGTGKFVPAVFDHPSDSPVSLREGQGRVGDILLFDGIFAHRPELRGYWDLSVFLEVPFETSIKRLGQRDGGPTDAQAPLNRRYIEGQELYLRECTPTDQATVIVDNTTPDSPRIIRWRRDSTDDLMAGLPDK